MKAADLEEQQFLAAVAALADRVEESYPAWALALRARPAVYVPHRHYFTCCEFPVEHPIHNLLDWRGWP